MAKKLIKLLGEPIQNEDDKAAAAITPGHLVTFDSSGNLIKHNVAGARTAKTFALEREESGTSIDTAYAINDTVKVGHFHAGCRVLALLAANAVAIVKGDHLESAGDGTLRKVLTTGQADLTDNSAGTANDVIEALPNPTDSPATADALRDDLVAVFIPALRNNIADLTAKVNAILPTGAQPGVIARALEAVDNSAVAAVARIRVEIL